MSSATAWIDLDALEQNLQIARLAASNSRISAVVKANGYGHGLELTAPCLERNHLVDGFSVATLDEGIQLRNMGIKKDIWIFAGVSSADEWQEAENSQLTPVVHSEHQLKSLAGGVFSGKICLELETGLGRTGLFSHQLKKALGNPQVGRRVTVIMSHFSDADRPQSCLVDQQLSLFDQSLADVRWPKSIAASGGILEWPESHLDWVRPGIMLYGASPFSGELGINRGLSPVMTLEAPIISIRRLPRGSRVGYGGTWECPEDMDIGVVRCGYGDGYPRRIDSGAYVMVNSQKSPIVGRVSMDSMTIDLRNVTGVKVGDPVRLWGRGIEIEMVSKWAETIPNELLSGLPKRVTRKVL